MYLQTPADRSFDEGQLVQLVQLLQGSKQEAALVHSAEEHLDTSRSSGPGGSDGSDGSSSSVGSGAQRRI